MAGALEAGTKIGNVVVERLSAKDAMGEVYNARLQPANTRAVLRLLPAEISANASFLQSLAGQLKAFSACRHENLAQVVAFKKIESLNRWLIVTSLGAGISLHDRIQQKNLSPLEAVAALKQALTGLEHAHTQGYVHGDINLDNVVISPDGKVKLACFAFTGVPEADRRARAEFQAPELLKSGIPSASADLYALGITLRKLFESLGVASVTPDIRRIAERMSTQNPKDRFPTAAAALAMLGVSQAADSVEDAQEVLTRGFEKSKIIQLEVDSEIRKARARGRMPSLFKLAVIVAVGYFGVTKVMPLVKDANLSGKGFAGIVQSLFGNALQTAAKVSGLKKLNESKKYVADTKEAAEKDMARRTAAADAVFAEDDAHAKNTP